MKLPTYDVNKPQEFAWSILQTMLGGIIFFAATQWNTFFAIQLPIDETSAGILAVLVAVGARSFIGQFVLKNSKPKAVRISLVHLNPMRLPEIEIDPHNVDDIDVVLNGSIWAKGVRHDPPVGRVEIKEIDAESALAFA